MKKKRLLILKRKVAVTSSMLSFYENISYRVLLYFLIVSYGGSSYDFKDI